MARGHGHAAVLHDRKEYMQLPQVQAPAHLKVPIDLLGHSGNP
jgi:hypothetical protein